MIDDDGDLNEIIVMNGERRKIFLRCSAAFATLPL
jgi:hypothetical protein